MPEDPETRAANRPQDIPRFSYQPALDGVRAVAVILVLLLHGSNNAFPFQFSSGWLGVDVFFLLSGYLITSLLLTEWAHNGRVNLRSFYARRFLRLAPLSIAVVVAVWTLARVAPTKSHLMLPNKGAISILLYFSNFVYQNDLAKLGTLLHFWSLSIEEQFYFVWPAVLLLIIRIAKGRWRTAAITFTVAVVATQWVVRRNLWVRDVTHHRDLIPTIVSYYADSFRRPDSLVLGCLLAVVLIGRKPGTRAIRASGLWAIAGLAAAVYVMYRSSVVTLAYTPDYFIPNWGLSLFNVSTLGILTWLVLQPASFVARFLALRPMVWIGRRSYAIYLLNPLPGLFLQSHDNWPWAIRTAIFLAFAFGGAALSYRFFERPFLHVKERFAVRGVAERSASNPSEAPNPSVASGTEG